MQWVGEQGESSQCHLETIGQGEAIDPSPINRINVNDLAYNNCFLGTSLDTIGCF